MAKGERRPLKFWDNFNAWWRGHYSAHSQRPDREELAKWYSEHAAATWNDAAPTLEELRIHAKSMRSIEEVHTYTLAYRSKRKDSDDEPPPKKTPPLFHRAHAGSPSSGTSGEAEVAQLHPATAALITEQLEPSDEPQTDCEQPAPVAAAADADQDPDEQAKEQAELLLFLRNSSRDPAPHTPPEQSLPARPRRRVIKPDSSWQAPRGVTEDLGPQYLDHGLQQEQDGGSVAPCVTYLPPHMPAQPPPAMQVQPNSQFRGMQLNLGMSCGFPMHLMGGMQHPVLQHGVFMVPAQGMPGGFPPRGMMMAHPGPMMMAHPGPGMALVIPAGHPPPGMMLPPGQYMPQALGQYPTLQPMGVVGQPDLGAAQEARRAKRSRSQSSRQTHVAEPESVDDNV